ncbi:general secretion pathway protein GspA [Vibrio albus]|uniref:General secretion pathway protein GspA n=2 Tax=Vibrio albus TaxID=2200953 RepID=A0A2U3B5C1_9VIBR|nr:general secretion pathway protein GspA [Vibrio albus]
MYKDYFGFVEKPFSIVPSARYLFLSARHREAMAHLQAGLGDGGGFAMLTGEVGTGKTTVSKAMLASLDGSVRAGLILNPTFSDTDLLEAICDEFAVDYPPQATLKQLTQAIHQYLLHNHSCGIQTLLLIDEAQHLSAQVLEQLRLLTNFETDTQKLLKVLLVGQPELQQKLQTVELRQLAQRITGRYHLLPLSPEEVTDYIGFRLRTSGCDKSLFTSRAIKIIARQSQGVPRLINLVCDKALQYACYASESRVSPALAEKACQDVLSFQAPAAGSRQPENNRSRWPVMSALTAAIILAGGGYYFTQQSYRTEPVQPPLMVQTEAESAVDPVSPPAEPDSVPEEEPDLVVDVQPVKSEPPAPVLPAEPEEHQEKMTDEPELAQFVRHSVSETDAMLALYQQWGVQASVLDAACSVAGSFPYICERRTGSLTEVKEANRPVILTVDYNGTTAYPVLYAVGREQAELINFSERISVPLSWLEKHWSGEFQLLWRSHIQPVLKSGSRGDVVQMLDDRLADALGSQPLQTRIFNSGLKLRVEAFQRWQRLSVDGIVGRETLRVLYRLTDTDAPQLQDVISEHSDPSGSMMMLTYPESGPLIALSALKVPDKQVIDVQPVQTTVSQLVSGKKPVPEWQLDELDLSELSPELAQRVENALQPESTGQREDEPVRPEQKIVKLEERQSDLTGRLPAMDLQTHMYSSSAEGRWVKINGQELHEGDWLDDQVQLLSISPRNIVVRFGGQQIEIPALYEWEG